MQYILFDLDNTVYPASSAVEHVFNRRIIEYVARFLGISIEEADTLRADGFLEHGTTAAWLMKEHGLADIEEYLDWIHLKDIGTYITPNPDLVSMLERIPQGKSILTNAVREHAERVLSALGIGHFFEHIFDIRDYGFRNKPAKHAYKVGLKGIGIPAEQVLFIDDNPKNMQPFIELGGHVLLVDEDNRHTTTPYPRIRYINELEEYLREKNWL